MQFPGWARGFHIQLAEPPTRALRPVIPINACTLRITAAAGTKVSRCLFLLVTSKQQGINLRPSSQLKVLYNPKTFFTHAAWLDQAFAHCPIFPLLPPVGV